MISILNQTISCPRCKGKGKIISPERKKIKVQNFSEESELDLSDRPKWIKRRIKCIDCNGSGVVIDSVIPDIIKTQFVEIVRGNLPKAIVEIYTHFEKKLIDAYKRGIRDGKQKSKKK